MATSLKLIELHHLTLYARLYNTPPHTHTQPPGPPMSHGGMMPPGPPPGLMQIPNSAPPIPGMPLPPMPLDIAPPVAKRTRAEDELIGEHEYISNNPVSGRSK